MVGGELQQILAGALELRVDQGALHIVPGVSGGTMALILGIYERLLRAIRSFDRDWLGLVLRGRLGAALSRNDLPFLAPLGAGILAALLAIQVIRQVRSETFTPVAV